ncbi:MAG: DUF547 domain-containing protein [Rhodospirillales bacterium]
MFTRMPRYRLFCRRFRPWTALAVLLGLCVLAPAEATAAPKAELWQRWARHDPQAAARIDHAAWDGFLARYVKTDADGPNRVAYGRVAPADKAALGAYIEGLGKISIGRFNRGEQRAYWINLYNALTVKLILDHAPVASIRDIDISPGLFSDGPWGKKLIRIENTEVGLDDIEHRILRPIWRDARLHYAVNCASVGCPDLMPRAFTAANTESLLEKGARAYVNSPRGARFENGRLIASKIYSWFAEDFGGDEAGVLAHLKRYANPDLARRLNGVTEIDSYDYDWRLNGAP